MLDQLEQSKIWDLMFTTVGIAMLTIHHYLMFGICFILDPTDILRQTSPDVHFTEEFCMYAVQT